MADYQEDVLLAAEMASYKAVKMAEKMVSRQVESKEKWLVIPLVVWMVDMQDLILDCLMAALMGSIVVVEMVENQVVYQVYLMVEQMTQTWRYVSVVKSVATTVYLLGRRLCCRIDYRKLCWLTRRLCCRIDRRLPTLLCRRLIRRI